MTMTAIGKVPGCSKAAASLTENGHTVPGIDTVERFARALGVEPCWLAFGNEGQRVFREKIPKSERAQDKSDQSTYEQTFTYKEAGKRVSERRKALNMSLRTVGEAAGISYQTVKLIESGDSIPKVDSLHRLAIALDVAPCWLAYGVGEPPIDPAVGSVPLDTQSAPTADAKA